LLASYAETLELMLAARVLQGLGAAGPRVIALAIIRDLYEGPKMARLMSFVMIIFTLVPAFAPFFGTFIILGFGWRAIFIAFVIFALIGGTWLSLRQAETLPVEKRRPLTLKKLVAAIKEMFSVRVAVLSILAQSLGFGVLFSHLSTIQPVFIEQFDRGETFHIWFLIIALCAGTASFLNASIVERIGMKPIIQTAFIGVAGLSVLMTIATMTQPPDGLLFPYYILWSISLFGMVGLTIGNLNAIAMQPLGHIAGFAASIIGSVATIAAVIIAVPIGLTFDGTPLSTALGVTVCAGLGALVTRMIH
jgi:DHA1 family bicyclomycin/chloramphenicol resistance-like MFS transporter